MLERRNQRLQGPRLQPTSLHRSTARIRIHGNGAKYRYRTLPPTKCKLHAGCASNGDCASCTAPWLLSASAMCCKNGPPTGRGSASNAPGQGCSATVTATAKAGRAERASTGKARPCAASIVTTSAACAPGLPGRAFSAAPGYFVHPVTWLCMPEMVTPRGGGLRHQRNMRLWGGATNVCSLLVSPHLSFRVSPRRNTPLAFTPH